ncbi:MAG: polya polymerase [Lachnospiraceae bacterium]|nr:polya polymerase [Lachnospiraceae bacterium]
MKIYNVNDVEKFLDTIKQCKGSVELVSQQGDRLNLKSELTKYLAITKLFNDDTFINEMELIASDPDDVKLLVDYMMMGE